MAIDEQATRSVEARDVGEQLDDLLAHAARTREPVIIEREAAEAIAEVRAEMFREFDWPLGRRQSAWAA